jgi:hypothetical protein
MNSRGSRSALLLALASLCACGESNDSSIVGTGHWGALEVSVESRPSPPRPGVNEVVVIITGERRRPVFDAVVSLRAQAGSPWVQAIEDGHVGVYRRAVNFGAGERALLQVQVRRGAEEQTLEFPVAILASR